MDGLLGYGAMFILGLICGAIFMRKNSTGNNGNSGGNNRLFNMFGGNRNSETRQAPPANNMMNAGMQRPNMGAPQRPPVMPGGSQNTQMPGGYNNQNNINNGGW